MGYLSLPGTSGAYAGTPDTTAVSVTGDFDARIRLSVPDVTPAANGMMFAHYNSADKGHYHFIRTTGRLDSGWQIDGGSEEFTDSGASLIGSTLSNDQVGWLRVTRDASTGVVQYFISATDTDDDTAVSWTQLGSDDSTTSGSVRDAGVEFRVGAYQAGGTQLFLTGNVYRMVMYSDLTETTKVLDADFADETTWAGDELSITEKANSATVTINGDAELVSTAAAAAAITGTAGDGCLESDIVTGGQTIIITLTNDTWVATVGDDNAITDALIAGIDSAQSEATGWDAVVKANMVHGDVVRTSDTVVTVTLAEEATYAITSDETITVTIPATALTSGEALVATPTFQVTNENPPGSGESLLLLGVG